MSNTPAKDRLAALVGKIENAVELTPGFTELDKEFFKSHTFINSNPSIVASDMEAFKLLVNLVNVMLSSTLGQYSAALANAKQFLKE